LSVYLSVTVCLSLCLSIRLCPLYMLTRQCFIQTSTKHWGKLGLLEGGGAE